MSMRNGGGAVGQASPPSPIRSIPAESPGKRTPSSARYQAELWGACPGVAMSLSLEPPRSSSAPSSRTMILPGSTGLIPPHSSTSGPRTSREEARSLEGSTRCLAPLE